MNKMRYITTSIFCFCVVSLFAFRKPDNAKPSKQSVTYRQNCAQATAQTDLDINNVRARLLVGGDVWWDGNSGQYIVPKVEPGELEVSSLFAGAVWIGGLDPAGNLKVAAQQFGTSSGNSDFWPGPLNSMGVTTQQTCIDWDKFFTVTGAEIDLHIAQFQEAVENDVDYDINLIPQGVKEWPGVGNEFFFDIFEFELPGMDQGSLGPFFDQNNDGIYTPQFGDYPIIEVRGCDEPQYPDLMKFWIYNDNGNVHTESGADPIQMEIQVQAFAYETNDELNNMTFQRYKLVNRAEESIDSTYFAMWVDADLGCPEDDYIGCDTTRSLMYVYNTDAVDGSSGANCIQGIATYGESIPYLGVDYFRGPLAPKIFGPNGTLINPGIGQPFDTIVEIGMTSFIYFNNAGSDTADPAQIDPGTSQEYYNYLTGSWLNGAPITEGGSGLGGTVPTNFVFPDEPNVEGGWSMCEEQLVEEDRRTVQASGPFRLDPGQVNELIIGVPWVPNVSYPCPDMGRLQSADDIAQGLFDSCFDILDGPDAPDVNWVELDQRLIAVLSNDDNSNNAFEAYAEEDAQAPIGIPNREYQFEGYIVYQLATANVSIDELDDPEKARIIFQSDIKNEGIDIFNWEDVENPNATILDDPTIKVPFLQVEGANAGVRSSFELTQDVFTGRPLINHTNYFYTALAYAYNEYAPFDVTFGEGQTTPYLEGRRNIQTYTVTPRPITDRNLQAEYGDGAVVTRLDGVGVGGNFLSISAEERNRLMAAQEEVGDYEGEVIYEEGGGPVEVTIIDPLRVTDGVYTLRLDQDAALETGNSAWELFDANNESLGRARQNLQNQNEQIFADLGLSVTIQQSDDAGDLADDTNGAIGQTISYEDERQAWLTPVPDNAVLPNIELYDLHFQPTGADELNSSLDPEQGFTNLGTGHFAPYTLLDWIEKNPFYATPAWIFPQSNFVQTQNPLDELNNVDIVFTSDKSLWSRCIVIETGNDYFTDEGFDLDDNKGNFEVVDRPSVGKEDNDGDGRPDEDGTGEGFAWFPGYAVDVETGVRLNIFFGENSAFGDNSVLTDDVLAVKNGSDMMFNPSPQTGNPPFAQGGTGLNFSVSNLILGGMHYMYVTRQPYDQCEFINDRLSQVSPFSRIEGVSLITWAGIGLGSFDAPMLSYADGLVPTETVVKLRADNPYREESATEDNAGFPSYQFEIANASPAFVTTEAEQNEQLDMINVVPNPYQAFSRYEANQFENVVKITNLPAKCVVTIYTLDGQFIRQYNRDEVELRNSGSNPGISSSQINPAIEWDLRNAAGIPIASGVYLIHVSAEGLGERVIKWFGVNRQFDPTGL